MADLQKLVDKVAPPADRDEDDEIWAGVGFGPNFYSQVRFTFMAMSYLPVFVFGCYNSYISCAQALRNISGILSGIGGNSRNDLRLRAEGN